MSPLLIPILVPLSAFLMVFGIVYILTTARNRERLAMIEKGMDPTDLMKGPERKNRFSSLKNALLALGVGLGGIIGFFIQGGQDFSDFLQSPVNIFLMIIGGGLGLLTYYFIASKIEQKEKEEDSSSPF
ncbi:MULTISPECIES: DUF6249 domain-containing protein [Persicobacter]|uniref:DUF6249 domain-containing protein n=1 Tax=Persicobacter diffluens TaxID=981 RepID=A0AAN4VTV4_9BACT|nr:DUF6249 domain-containing protein [Persicobacter sp. CCB-QB2]GJM59886.1 hypothetical protein PEDI_04380 [Persicobacter diffluens]